MPELPDITVYIEALEKRILGQRLQRVRIVSPFLLRTVEPAVASVEGKKAVEVRRLGEGVFIGWGGGGWAAGQFSVVGGLARGGAEGGGCAKDGREGRGKAQAT